MDKVNDESLASSIPNFQPENDSSVDSDSVKKESREKSLINIEIKQESVNYLGYYSSHKQLMQQLILDCANSTQKKIRDMVTQGWYHVSRFSLHKLFCKILVNFLRNLNCVVWYSKLFQK